MSLHRRHPVLLGAVLLTGCSAAHGPMSFSPEGRVWRESFVENFAVDLSSGEADCMAERVGGLTRMVGPLSGQRPDDEPGSVWAALDDCLSATHLGEVARAIVHGPSADESTAPADWAAAARQLAECIGDAGGWGALGSYQQLIATCGPNEGEQG